MKKRLLVIIPLLVLIGLIGWRVAQKRAETASQTAQRTARTGMPVSVELASPQIRDIVDTFQATGSVEAIKNIKISPKVTGQIDYLEVREGDRVRQGQVLVRIDPSEMQAEVRRQQAALAESRYRLAQARLTQTTTDSAVTTQIQQQQAGLAGAQADLHQVEETYKAQLVATKASLEDAQSKIDSANAAVANANANIKSAQANLDNATARYNRVLGLYKQGYVATQDVDDARTAVSVQQSLVETARGQLQSAAAAVGSVSAQKRSAEQQGSIVRGKAYADIEAARAKVAQAKASLEYARANARQTPAYRQNLEALSAGVAVAQASLDGARSKLADTVLRSPLDGVVTARNQDSGALALSGQPLLTVQAMNKVWVTIAVPEDVCVKIHLNQKADVTFDSLKGRTFAARIAQINPSADSLSRQYTVRVLLDNSDNIFKAGMFAHVTLVTGQASGMLAVPREAVKTDKDGSSYVIAAGRDGKAVRRPVVTGASDAGWIGITAGLTPRDRVVTMSASPVREGQQLGTGREGKGGPGGGRRNQSGRR
ncbi:MAG: efflux RND transporter periplasmic adaptor subunit [bacterium]|nr:efflux RND transporter periplasmic adaptor subunit [bacterium]